MFLGRSSKKKYRIYSPSYKRHDTCISHHLFKPDTFTYVVREEEEYLYRPLGVDLKIIPEGKVKCISTTRNWILDNRDEDHIVTVDDDMKAMYWILRRERVELNQDDIDHQIKNGFQMAEDLETGMWGVQVNADPMTYSTKYPFLLNKPILGPFTGILDQELRYDESLPLKEDYDLFLQMMQKYRKVLRFEYLAYLVDHQKLAGGCQTYRTVEAEKENIRLFKKKWGDKIIRDNERNPDSINMRIRLPI